MAPRPNNQAMKRNACKSAFLIISPCNVVFTIVRFGTLSGDALLAAIKAKDEKKVTCFSYAIPHDSIIRPIWSLQRVVLYDIRPYP